MLKHVGFAMEAPLACHIDDLARQEGTTRAEMIRRAVREALLVDAIAPNEGRPGMIYGRLTAPQDEIDQLHTVCRRLRRSASDYIRQALIRAYGERENE